MKRRSFLSLLGAAPLYSLGATLLENPLFPGIAQALPAPTVASRIDGLVTKTPLPGLAVCVVDGQSLTFAEGFGYADVARKLPVTVDTPFLLASVSKLFTGVAALQLFDEGRVALDADINTYLPFSVRHERFPSTPITVRMLLTHTSGIRDNYGVTNELYSVGDPELPLGEFLRGYLNAGGAYYQPGRNYYPRFAPGTSYQYSNTGVALLGYLVESIVGIPFDQRCDQTIFTPLSMTKTSWKLSGLDVEEVALPYTARRSGRSIRFSTDGQYGFPDYPDGLLRSSTRDLSVFLAALMNGGAVGGTRILKASTIELMMTPQIPDLDDSQGLIGYYERNRKGFVFGHSGAETGVATRMFFHPQSKRGVIVLTNIDEDYAPVEGALAKIERILFELT